MERRGTSPGNASLVEVAAVVLVVDLVEEEVVEVEAVTATTVVSRVTCRATAPSRVRVAAAEEAATVPATTAGRADTSRVTVRTRWEEEEAVAAAETTAVATAASATTATRPDICLATARTPTGVRRTGAESSASGATRWVTLLVTARTAAEVDRVADPAAAAVVVVAAPTCAATTATKSDTSRATVRPLRRRVVCRQPSGGQSVRC